MSTIECLNPILAPGQQRHSLRLHGRVVLVGLWAAGLLLAVSGRAQAPTPSFDFVANDRVTGSPGVGLDGTLYFGAVNGRLFAVRPDGSKRWELPLSSAVPAAPTVGDDETVYVATLDGRVTAVSPTGALHWSVAGGAEISSAITLGIDGTLYVGLLDGRLRALEPRDGSTRWSFTAGGGIYGAPSLGADGAIFLGARDGRVYALNSDGTRRWAFLTSGPVEASPAPGSEGQVIVGSTDGRIYALDPQDGHRLWDFQAGTAIYSSAAIGLDGRICVADYNGTVYALTSAGALLWQTNLTASVAYSSAALAADGTLYIGSVDGRLHALSADGRLKWSYATKGRIGFASPVISPAGTVYVASESGHVYGLPVGNAAAAGAWPMLGRDPRHTGGGFVDRRLPPGYSAGEEMTVTLVATVPARVGFYTVEDTPPANWQIGEISDNGVFDGTNRRVKFGPFLDQHSRQLTYKITPPLGESGRRFFTGSSAANGAERLLGGVHAVEAIPLHPADNRPADNWVTLGELTGYITAWKRGIAWGVGPNPIPSTYLDRAIEIWQAGEVYRFDTNLTAPPNWWTTTPTATQPLLPPPVSNPAPTNGLILSDMPVAGQPGTNFVVQLTVTPASNVLVYAVEDQPPAGWQMSELQVEGQAGGFVDAARGKVKWGPFFDNKPRTLTYRVTAPANANGTVQFQGAAAFDGSRAQTGGIRQFHVSSALDDGPFVLRELPTSYSPGARLSVILHARPPAGTGWQVIEDSPPAAWLVSEVSDAGAFDSASRKVRFGPFPDDAPRELSYVVIPPPGETGREQFLGSTWRDGQEALIGGDATTDLMPLHPADLQPVDAWMTITEVTAYGAAWKRGATWVAAPSPIPPSYLTRAIDLWWGGERYTHDSATTNSPADWVNVTGSLPSDDAPPGIPEGASTPAGSVIADAPKVFTPGTSLTIRLTVKAGTNTVAQAMEDLVPPGWTVSDISDGGRWDAVRGKVKWGPFFDGAARSLSYHVQIPEAETNVVAFHGGAAFNGSPAETTGARLLYRAGTGAEPAFTRVRILPEAGCELEIRGLTNEVYVLEASGALADWQSLAKLTNTTGRLKYVDSTATKTMSRFYRILWP